MIEHLSSFIKGHVTVKDAETGEILLDKDNAVHFGNISTAIAKSLTGDRSSFITYMAFGNGGVIIDSAGNIIYRKPNTSIYKNPNDQLYNTTFVYEMTNNDPGNVADPNVDVPGGNTKNFDDVVCVVVLGPNIPNGQQNIDNATGIGNQNSTDTTTNFVFNELALYTGPKGQNTTPLDFVSNPETLLITHVIFHPVQKSANRTLEITYTLRIQMGD
jgi:hypothetical protein